MHDDLLDAQACIDWTRAQLPSLERRLDVWLDANLYLEVKDADPHSPNNIIIALQREVLPSTFNVEVGCYINALRSSLDLLATALAHRHGVREPDSHCFPIAASEAKFRSGVYKGIKFVKGLPAVEADKIRTLKPYHGGNLLLWLLHDLDNVRKHRRLLTVVALPAKFVITGWGVRRFYTPLSTNFMPVNDQETVVGLVSKHAPAFDMKIKGCVALPVEVAKVHKPIIGLLNEFATLADAIIRLFK